MKSIPITLFSLLLGLALTHSAPGLTVNVDFSRDETGPLGGLASPLFSGTAVAPDAGTVWNDYDISMDGAGSTVPVPYQVDNLVDSTGAATTIDLEMTSGWYRAFNASITANDLQREWVFANSPSIGIATIKGLESLGSYDLYLITAGTRETDFTVKGRTKSATAAFTANPGTWLPGKEYVKFQSVTADVNGELVINVAAGGAETAGEWSGLQIVTAPPAPPLNFLYAQAAASTGGQFNASYPPSNLMNNGFTSPADTIDTTTTYLAAGNNYATLNGTVDNFDLTFEFATSATLDGMHVWNYVYRTAANFGDTSINSGVNAYTLTFYDGPGATGAQIGNVFAGSLAQAAFNALNPAESVYFPSPYSNVRSVVMHVTTNHGATTFTGMNELAFNGVTSGPASEITSFTTSASFVQRPALPTLSWEIEEDITSLEITPGVGDVTGITTDGGGSVEVSPIGDQTYTLTLNGSIAQTVKVVGLPTREKLHIYLLIGQSNMQGEGNDGKNTVLDAPDPRVVKFGSRSDAGLVDFITGGHRLTSYNSVPGSNIGMGVEFGKTLIAAETDPEIVVCLINHAVGGTAIERWEPGVTDPIHTNPDTSQPYKLYDEALARAVAASAYGTVKGVLWHQGEYNVNNGTVAPGYPARLAALVDNLREDLNSPGLPFVCGKLVPTYNFTNDRSIVENALAGLPDQRANTFCVDNVGLSANAADPIHFNAPSQRILGQRYAAATLDFYADPYRLYLGGFLTPNELADPQTTDPLGDMDFDGVINFLEYAFLMDPTQTQPIQPFAYNNVTVPGEGEFPAIRYRKRFDTEAPEYHVAVSADLLNWTSNLDGPAVTVPFGAPLDNGDGTSTVTERLLLPAGPANPRRFLRVSTSGP